jgi:uncharacterized protein YukE
MSFEGMDVDQLRGLAKQIDSDAQALDNLVTTLTGVVGVLTLLWNGPVAATFEQDWQSKNRPALLAAYNILTALHTHLVNNINQQISASGADGGWVADAREGWDKWQDIDGKWVSPIQTPVGLIHDLSGKDYSPGTKAYDEYSKAWSKLIQVDHDSSFLKYHESSVLRYIHDASFVQKTDKILVDTRIADFLGPVGMILAAPDAIVNSGEAIVDLKDHHYNSAIQHLGNVAEDEGGVVGLLAGGATRLYAEDYEIGKQIQWGQVPNPFSGNNWQTDWLPSLEATPLETLDIVKNAFLG